MCNMSKGVQLMESLCDVLMLNERRAMAQGGAGQRDVSAC